MAVQTHGFLVNGGLVGKKGSLGHKAAFVNAAVTQQFLQAGVQFVAVRLHAPGTSLLDFGNQFLDRVQTPCHVRLELFALDGAHRHKGIDRLQSHALHVLPQLVLVGRGSRLGQNLGEAGDHTRCDVVFQLHFFNQGIQRGAVALRQRPVDRHNGVRRRDGLDGQAQFHLAAADLGSHQLFELILQKCAGARQTGGILKKTRIDAAQLHLDIATVQQSPCTSVTGHT